MPVNREAATASARRGGLPGTRRPAGLVVEREGVGLAAATPARSRCGNWATAASDGGVLAVAAQKRHSGLNLSDSARKNAPALHGASPVKFSSPFRCFAAGAALSVF